MDLPFGVWGGLSSWCVGGELQRRGLPQAKGAKGGSSEDFLGDFLEQLWVNH